MTEEGKPLTREDVLKLIEEHGGPEGLDLSGRNLEEIDLSSPEEGPRLDLHGIILQGANLWRADLQEAGLQNANLKGADLLGVNLQGANLLNAVLQRAFMWHAELQEANLLGADLQGADLMFANLQGADLSYAKLSKVKLYHVTMSHETRLDKVDWEPNYILGEEVEATQSGYLEGSFGLAETVYRSLKQWHTEAGMYDIAGEFLFREMTVRRKTLNWWPNPVPRAWSKFLAVLCGYGEKPFRVVASAVVVVFGMAAIYSASALTFLDSLYYSAASFTALGYGLWTPTPEGWVKALGAIEAFIGVFLIALFLITFVRKMTR